jgi:hypothetical protein
VIVHYFITLLSLAFSLTAFADPVAEYQLKAGYAYNFAVNSEWPESGRVNFNFCTLNEDNVGLALRRFEGKPLQGRRLVVARLTSLVAINQCQVLYIGAGEAVNLSRILRQLGDEAVLTISDSPALSAVCVKLELEGERLVFDLNLERCRQARVKPSANMLRLAREVLKP